MPFLISMIIWVICICAGHIVQAVTGFGAFAVALPILFLFFDAKLIVPILVALNLFLCVTVTVRTRSHIDWSHAKKILYLSLPGTPIGWLLFRSLPGDGLKFILGLLAISAAAWNLWQIFRPSYTPPEFPKWADVLILILAGVSHGAYGTGGLVVCFYLTRYITNKTVFQSTMSIVWALQNLMVCLLYTIGGNWKIEMLPYFGVGLPVVLGSIAIGMWLHHKINQRLFLMLVFGIMMFSGAVLVVQTAYRLF